MTRSFVCDRIKANKERGGMSIKVFISSVQVEFASERVRLYNYIQNDALLGRFFVPFIFENEPAANKSAQAVYLKEVEQCDIYLGLFGCRYGYEDIEGVSPTEREYDTATMYGKHRLIYIKRTQGRQKRHVKQIKLIQKAEQSVVRKTFSSYEELQEAVYDSLIRYLEENDYIRKLPFDASICHGATIDDIDCAKLEHFVMLAKAHRGFPLSYSVGAVALLTQLKLMTDAGRLTNSAILLFGKRPQDFFPCTTVKCAQFYGATVCKPIPSHHVFKGTVFDVVDKAVDFVMSRIDVHVGTRAYSTAVDVTCEIPREAVAEAIVNAVIHRDYTSNASVQVMLFKDRLEVWNPGRLPYGLNIEKLHFPHISIPANPTLAHSAYLAGYIEEMGTGTFDIVEKCIDHGLEMPDFIQDELFKLVIWREHRDDMQGEFVEESNTDSEIQAWEKRLKQIKMQQALFVNKVKRTNRASVIEKKRQVVSFCSVPRSSNEIMAHIGVTRQTRTVNLYINELVKAGELRLLIPEKPNSPKQRYISVKGSLN